MEPPAPPSGPKRIELRPLKHNDQELIALHFAFDPKLMEFVNQFSALTWSQEHKCLCMAHNAHNIAQFLMYIKGHSIWVDQTPLKADKPVKQQRITARKPELSADALDKVNVFQRYMEQRRYSISTVQTYVSMITQFFANTSIRWDAVTNRDIETYNHMEFITKKKSYSTQNQFINAIKLFYECHGKGHVIPEDIERPRKEHRLPNVLSQEEVKRLLVSLTNLKHRALLCLIYACGLRIGDALGLRLEDVRDAEGLLYIRAGKGRKDRRVPLTPPMHALLQSYLDAYRPKVYVFEGQSGGRYSYKSAQQVMKRAAQSVGLRQKVTLHTLRHSYATHQIQMGTDSRYIQEILGHNDPKTTMLYTHIAMKDIKKIKSPFDDMGII